MTIEATLTRIDATLSALLVIAQTSAAAHTFGTAVSEVADALPTSVKATRTKTVKEAPAAVEPVTAPTATPAPVAGPLGLVDGDPQGTRYWLIEAHNTVYAEHPGMPGCSIGGAIITTAAEYLAKKAEFAKKSLIVPAAVAQSLSPTSTSAATAGPASTASSSDLSDTLVVTFKEVTDELMALAKDTREGRGRGAIVDLLAKYLPGVAAAERKVPTLAGLNKNLAILSEVRALLANDPAPVAVVEEEDIFA